MRGPSGILYGGRKWRRVRAEGRAGQVRGTAMATGLDWTGSQGKHKHKAESTNIPGTFTIRGFQWVRMGPVIVGERGLVLP